MTFGISVIVQMLIFSPRLIFVTSEVGKGQQNGSLACTFLLESN